MRLHTVNIVESGDKGKQKLKRWWTKKRNGITQIRYKLFIFAMHAVMVLIEYCSR